SLPASPVCALLPSPAPPSSHVSYHLRCFPCSSGRIYYSLCSEASGTLPGMISSLPPGGRHAARISYSHCPSPLSPCRTGLQPPVRQMIHMCWVPGRPYRQPLPPAPAPSSPAPRNHHHISS